ncbi:MAG: hypothetical protein U5J83_01475 [Bryobacterales bacterium]|nr:hypothetical protein [Bryobacterales bacterium]
MQATAPATTVQANRRHGYDAILTGIGTLLFDDCLLNDRSGQVSRTAPVARRRRFPAPHPRNSRMVRELRQADVALIFITAAAPPKAKAKSRKCSAKAGAGGWLSALDRAGKVASSLPQTGGLHLADGG